MLFLIQNVQNGLFDFTGVIILGILLVLYISNTTRRLHDMGYGSVFIIFFATILNFATIILAVVPGQKGTNAYGPQPTSKNDELQ